MKHTIQFFLVIFMLSILISCKNNKKPSIDIKMLGQESSDAINPYFTKDQKGNVVLCWTAKDSADSIYRLKYSVYDSINDAFKEVITVSTSAGTGTSPESMGKVAFKPNGDVIAVFSRKHESAESPYAGAVYYSTSTDNGQNWSQEKIIHSDTSKNVGHSFFDITRLKDGEIGAIWLDGRYGKSEKGLALFFAKTQNGNEFGKDTLLDKNTCECCRTEILTDNEGNIHIAYRGLGPSSKNFGKQIRDMVYLSSEDNGNTFSKIKPISDDNWEIDGCPHTGPSLAVNNQVNAVWYTAVRETGIYYAFSQNLNTNFNRPILVSSTGKHPQMAALDENTVAIVYEDMKKKGKHSMEDNHSHSSMAMDHSKMNHSQATKAKITLSLFKNSKETKNIEITNGEHPAHHAVIQSVNNRLFIAWVHEEAGKAAINYTKLIKL